VVGIPDPLKGELAVGCIVIRSESAVSEEILISYCKERLASYKVPRRIQFFEEFPLGPTGKILKKDIQQRLCSV
jgi:long-chain acyl-CoA synthetase